MEKKIKELNDQIRVYKNELSDKQKEFAQEKADLQLVIDQQKKGGEEASTAELDKVKKDLEKAQKELQEGAVEKERFQAQLEMLVQELEQKQVSYLISIKLLISRDITRRYVFDMIEKPQKKELTFFSTEIESYEVLFLDSEFPSFEHLSP